MKKTLTVVALMMGIAAVAQDKTDTSKLPPILTGITISRSPIVGGRINNHGHYIITEKYNPDGTYEIYNEARIPIGYYADTVFEREGKSIYKSFVVFYDRKMIFKVSWKDDYFNTFVDTSFVNRFGTK